MGDVAIVDPEYFTWVEVQFVVKFGVIERPIQPVQCIFSVGVYGGAGQSLSFFNPVTHVAKGHFLFSGVEREDRKLIR